MYTSVHLFVCASVFPSHGADPCGNPCGAVTNCKACYYSKEKKPLPDGCDAKLRKCDREEDLKRCLSKWGQCLKTRYKELYGKVQWEFVCVCKGVVCVCARVCVRACVCVCVCPLIP